MAEVRRTGPGAVVGNVALYGTLTVAAILFLVPFYLLIRNGTEMAAFDLREVQGSDLDFPGPLGLTAELV